jgi:hypothetical protein
MVRQLQARLGWAWTKAVLGLPGATICNWFRLRRGRVTWPCRRTIWLTWSLVFKPDNLCDLRTVIMWGKVP